jgi:chromosome segregation ATPase
MSPGQLLEGIELRLLAISRWLGQDDPRAALHAEMTRTAEELQQCHAVLKAAQQSLREACARLLEGERQVEELQSAVRTCTAARDRATALCRALELEEARNALIAERANVEQLQHACLDHQTDMTRLEAHLAGLQTRLGPC